MGDQRNGSAHNNPAGVGDQSQPSDNLSDPHAFSDIVRRSHGAIYLTALAIVRDADTAHDITQETFLRAWLKVDTLRDASLIQPWLGRIARNLAAQWLRTGQQRSRVLPLISMEDIIVEPADNTRPDPRQAAGQAEEKGQLTDAVMALPDDLRQAVVLHYAEGMTPSDIARLNGEAPSTVTRRLDKARQLLRQHLECGLAANLAASVQQLRPANARLQRTLGIITAATTLPAVTRAQLLNLVANTPPPPLIDPVTSAATAAHLKEAGIMKTTIAKAGAGKLLATGAAAALIIGGGAYAVVSVTTTTDRVDGTPEVRSKTVISESPVNGYLDRSLTNSSIRSESAAEADAPAKPGTAEAPVTQSRRRLTPDERLALLKDDMASSQPMLVKSDGETSDRLYFNIELIDESGMPVKGAEVQVDQILHSQRGSFGFETIPQRISSNDKGLARVYVPRYFDELIETDGVVVKVMHPDYASSSEILSFKNLKKVILRLGDTLKVYAYDNTSSEPIIAGLEPTQGPLYNSKLDYDFGSDGSITIRKINVGRFSKGTFGFYLTAKNPQGEELISDYQNVEFPRTSDEALHLTLHKTLKVLGEVSPNVPRPVKNGEVVAVHKSGEDNCGAYLYQKMPVSEDGTFSLTKLTPGTVFIWALTDGWCSVDSDRDNWQGQPQEFELNHDMQNYILPMEETATVELTVVDQNGDPVEGLITGTNPNMCVEGCCGIWIRPGFSALTDKDGKAIIFDLPPLKESRFSLHGEWELQPDQRKSGYLDRSVALDLLPGETEQLKVVAYPVGSTKLTQNDDIITTVSGSLGNQQSLD